MKKRMNPNSVMKGLFSTLFLLVMVLAATAQEQPKMSPSDAVLKLHATSYHFGDVARRGGDLEYELRYTNEGTTPLVVTRVVTSCSCLKAHFQRRPLAPGQEGVIRIVYEPQKSEPGVFNKVIQIYSNARDGRAIFTVQGNAVEAPRIKIKEEKIVIKY